MNSSRFLKICSVFTEFCCSLCFLSTVVLLFFAAVVVVIVFSVMVFVGLFMHLRSISILLRDWDTVCARRVSTLILLPTFCCYNSEPNDFATIAFHWYWSFIVRTPSTSIIVWLSSFTHYFRSHTFACHTLSHTVITWFRQWCMYNNFQLKRLLVYVLSSPASRTHTDTNPGFNGNTKPVQ